jgi:hypothetical protein
VDDPEVGQAAVASVEVEAVADEVLVRDGEADVTERKVVDEPAIGAIQEGARCHLARPAELEGLHEIVERQPGVDDVLDDEDIAVRDREVEVFDQTDLRPSPEGPVVAGEDDEVERMGDGKGPREIGEEDERPFEDGDDDGIPARIVLGQLRAELDDASLDLVLREVDLSDPRVAGLYEARFSLYFWARRSKSRRVKSLILTSG